MRRFLSLEEFCSTFDVTQDEKKQVEKLLFKQDKKF
jgi:hypothetical protein